MAGGGGGGGKVGRAHSLDNLSSEEGTHARLGSINCRVDGLVTTGPFVLLDSSFE